MHSSSQPKAKKVILVHEVSGLQGLRKAPPHTAWQACVLLQRVKGLKSPLGELDYMKSDAALFSFSWVRESLLP
jgi:hypothetical protein